MRWGTGTPCHASVPWVAGKNLPPPGEASPALWEVRNCLSGFREVSVPLGSCLGGQGRGRVNQREGGLSSQDMHLE